MSRIGLNLALVAMLSGMTMLHAQTGEPNCVATILNRSVQLGPGGSFGVPNLPVSPGYYRVRIVCTSDGQVSGGQSGYFFIGANQATFSPPIVYGPLSPIPIELTVASPKTNLATKGETTQLIAIALFSDTTTTNVSSPAQGTFWSSSNTNVADVTTNGLVTAVARGTALIQALNEGVQATFSMEVNIPSDSDGDGIPDDYEIAFGLDPNDPSDGNLDLDADGLSNLQEFQLGTNPKTADTDRDDVSDGEEVRAGTNPLKADSDLDGLTDGQEIRRGLNPLARDTDGDGLEDGLELRFELNPLVADVTTRVQGRVLDTNGTPAARVKIIILDVLTTQTDESGSYALANVPASIGPITVAAQIVRTGRVFDGASTAAAVAGGVTELPTITLRLNSGNVIGTVTDPLSGPVADALVTVSNGQDTRTAKTDANGFYRVSNMTAGSLLVTARDPKTGLRGPARGTLALNQSATVNVRLGPFGAVAGTVYQRNGVTPVGAGVNIVISGPTNLTAKTDALGKYRFDFVPLGAYVVDATDTGGNHGRTSGDQTATSQVLISDISFLGQGTIIGLVLNGAQPVSNAAVSFSSLGVFSGSANTVSDGAGRFNFSNRFVGPYFITARIGSPSLGGSVTGAVQQESQVISNNVVLAASGTITGTVFRADGSTPAVGVDVALLNVRLSSVLSMGVRTVTDDSGRFGFTQIPLGTYLVDATDTETGDRARGGGGIISAQGQIITGNVNLAGQGSVAVTVRDGGGVPVQGAQVTLHTALPYSANYFGVTDAGGAYEFGLILANTFTINVIDSTTGLTTNRSGSIGVGLATNLIIQLPGAGSIAGRVLLPDGTNPAPNMQVRVASSIVQPGIQSINKQQNSAVDGQYRFNNLPAASYSLEVIDGSGNRRATATGLVVSVHGQVVNRDLILSGVGTVTGIVRNPDSSPAPGVGVYVRSLAASSYFNQGGNADVNGRYTIRNVPLGPFTASVLISSPSTILGQIQSFGSAAGQIQTNGQVVAADVLLSGDMLPTTVAFRDGNNLPYDSQAAGGVRSGAFSAFGGAVSTRGAGRLEIVSAGTPTPFLGSAFGTLNAARNEISITQTGLAGLNVTRRMFVPRNGYFARCVEVISNPGPSAVTMEVRLTSNFRTASLGTNRIIATSSGDSVLNVTNGAARDRWVVIDDSLDADPLLTNSVPAVAHIFDGTNGVRQASTATFTQDTTNGFALLVQRWTNITILPGTNAMLMHLIAQQVNRTGAQAAAVRLAQVPPEVLTGLTFAELRSVQNFGLPTNGIGPVPPLVGLTGSVSGLVLASDNATVIPNATVRYRSTNVLFGRTDTARADSAGRFSFANYLANAYNGVIPLNGYNLTATHPLVSTLTANALGTFPGASVASTQNVVFSGAGMLVGTVRRPNTVVASAGNVRATAEVLPGSVNAAIAANGIYRVSALPPATYALFAEVPAPQGTVLRGAASAPIVVGQTTTADIVIEETGTLTGTLRRTNGSVVVSLRVYLRGTNNLTRSVLTDTGGRFTFGDVPSGAVSLDAFDPANNTAAYVEGTVLTDQTVVQDLTLSSGGTVKGLVLTTGGQPLSGAEVTVVSSAGVFTTVANSNGFYQINTVPLGGVTVAARDPGTTFRGVTNGNLAVSGQTLNLNLYPAAVGTVVGTVYRPDGVTPAPNAGVSVLGGALATIADASGQYSIDFVPVGNFNLTAVHPASGEAGLSAIQINSNDQVATANVVLFPAVVISGTTNAEGNAGTRDAVFTLRLSSPPVQAGTLAYRTTNGTAVGLSDYQPTNGTVIFPPGVTNRTITVKMLGDIVQEANETFFVNLSGPTNLTLFASQAMGVITNDDRLPGQIDHFTWDPVPGPQLDQVPFPVIVTARDASNVIVTNFTGPAQLSAVIGGGPFSGTLLGLPVHNVRETNAFTIEAGYTFRPTNDILVTHVVHYFGNRVNISTEAGQLLIAQGVTSTPGTWIETPVQQPVLLTNGGFYKVTTMLQPGSFGYRRLGLLKRFQHGTLGFIGQNSDYFGWWMVDFRYTPVTSVAVSLAPTNTGPFSNGVWSGNVSVLAPVTNAVMVADDGDGHQGAANSIDVLYGNDLRLTVQGSPEPVDLGGTLIYKVTVTNTGPNLATGVVVTNVLPEGFNYILAYSPQGMCSFSNRTVTCAIPSLARGTNAVLSIVVQPAAVVSEFNYSTATWSTVPVTNAVGVARTETDGYPGNNLATAITTVLRPALTISDATVREGNGEVRIAVFDVRLSYPSTEAVYLFFQTSNGTAIAGIDYVPFFGNLNFWPGETNKTIRVRVLGNSVVESNKTFYLNLYESSSASLAKRTGACVILNDDGLPGQIDHFDWAAIPSPQFIHEPFAVSLTAKNAAGGTVSNFAGQAFLSGYVPAEGRTNQLLTDEPASASYPLPPNYEATQGFAFVPATNLTVTHFRRYFGDKVSLWADDGLLLASLVITGAPAVWIEAPLPIPLELSAGVRYLITTRARGEPRYVKYFGQPDFDFPDGVCETNYYTAYGGDKFPTDFSTFMPSYYRYMVGLKYTVGTRPPVPISPTNTGAFTNGVWSGWLTVSVPAGNLVLRADDGDDDRGEANPIEVLVRNDLSVTAVTSPALADVRSNLTYTIIVTNIGPASATGVTLTNELPAEVNLLSVVPSQGSSSIAGRTVTCNLGTLADGAGATITIVTKPVLDGIVLTNLASVGRTEADGYLNNNTVVLATPVAGFRGGAVAILAAEGVSSWNEDVRAKLESSGFFPRVDLFQMNGALPVPSLSQLQQYGAVFVYSDDTFSDSVALGNALADYVDGGAGLVVATFTFGSSHALQGRIGSEDYLPFTIGSYSSDSYPSLVADAPQHPMLEGVASFIGGNSTYYNDSISLTPGAVLVAHWSNDQPLVGVKQLASGRTVGLNFFPPSSDVFDESWDSTTDGARLMANALRWAAPLPETLPNDLVLSLAQAPLHLPAGGLLTYTLLVTNTGPSPATGVLLTNVLPPGVAVVSLSSSRGTVTNLGGTVLASLGTLPTGTNAVITITAQTVVTGRITNTAAIGRAEPDAYLRNNRAVSVATVEPPAITAEDVIVTEAESGTTNAIFTVQLSFASPETVLVNFQTLNGYAQAGSDFIGTNGTLVFLPGETNLAIPVTILHDVFHENDEYFYLYLSGATNATLPADLFVGTILDNDPLPVLAISDASVVEGDVRTRTADFTVTLTPASGVNVFVSFLITNGTALAGSDYLDDTLYVAFSAGETNQTISVPIFGDRIVESNETFFVTMSVLEGATLGRSEGTGTIVNDDGFPGRLDHFDWSAIPSPQIVNIPFPVTVAAKDSFGANVLDFAGPVLISDGFPLLRTNTFIPVTSTHGHYSLTSQEITKGYAFTPANDLLVTHVRNYFGTKVSIWTDTGELIVSQNVPNGSGHWIETGLPTAVTLHRGVRYRIGVRTGPNSYYYYDPQGLAYIPDLVGGYLYQYGNFYSGVGDGFPTGYDSSISLVDLRYRTPLPLRWQPAATGTFTNGVWAGQVTALAASSNLVLSVDADGEGHNGAGNPIVVLPQREFTVAAGPNPVALGSTLRFLLTIRNLGSTPATGVMITNLLPAGLNFLSVTQSQGTSVNVGGVTILNVGTLAPAAAATIRLLVQPATPGSFTNVSWAVRDGVALNPAHHAVTNLVRVNASAQSVGYFTDGNELTLAPGDLIARVGLNPVHITDITSFDLDSVPILFLNEFSLPPTLALRARLPAIQSWVNAGGVLVLHDGYGSGAYFDSLLPEAQYIYAPWNAYLSVTPPADTLVTAGPYGTIVDYDPQGQFGMVLGNYAPMLIPDSMPASARAILQLGSDRLTAFTYPLGQGHVYYSAIPLDYYLELPDARVFTNVYAPNVLVYAQSLISSTVTNVPRNPQFIFGPGTTTWTNGGFQLQVGGLTGHGPVVISASSNLLDWEPVFTNPPAVGTLQYFDATITNRPARFYRVEER